jgi:Domain of unknown function (DUF4388)
LLHKKSLTNIPAIATRTAMAVVPGMKTLHGMVTDARQSVGRVIEQRFLVRAPFGDTQESFSLTLTIDGRGNCAWMLYRGEGTKSFVDWSVNTREPMDIAQHLMGAFPGYEFESDVVATQQQDKKELFESTTSPTLEMYGEQAELEGDLLLMQLPTLLQSIGMDRLTGRLEISSSKDKATVFFNEGIPIHCLTRWEKGEPALLEIGGWTEGEFKFYKGPRTSTITVKRRLNALLLESATLRDQSDQLQNLGVKDISYLARKMELQTQDQLASAVETGTGCNPKLQWELYCAVDGESTLVELLRRIKLSKSAWIPALFNLLDCGVLMFSDEPFVVKEEQNDEKIVSLAVDWNAVELVDRGLRRPETGLLTYPSFLLFLNNEFARNACHSSVFSVVLIEALAYVSLHTVDGDKALQRTALPQKDAVRFRQAIELLKLESDLLAHFETFGYALLMPETDEMQVKIFCDRANLALNDLELTSPDGNDLVIRMGAVTVPSESKVLEEALGLARSRMGIRLD